MKRNKYKVLYSNLSIALPCLMQCSDNHNYEHILRS